MCCLGQNCYVQLLGLHVLIVMGTAARCQQLCAAAADAGMKMPDSFIPEDACATVQGTAWKEFVMCRCKLCEELLCQLK